MARSNWPTSSFQSLIMKRVLSGLGGLVDEAALRRKKLFSSAPTRLHPHDAQDPRHEHVLLDTLSSLVTAVPVREAEALNWSRQVAISGSATHPQYDRRHDPGQQVHHEHSTRQSSSEPYDFLLDGAERGKIKRAGTKQIPQQP
jgi:hypothetical protein